MYCKSTSLQNFGGWVKSMTLSDRHQTRVRGRDQRLMRRPTEADGWWKSDSALFLLPSLSCVFILRLSFVIGGGPFFLSRDSQLQIMRRQMEGPASQIEMGWGEPRPASHVWCLSPGPHPLCHPPGWCWQMELRDTNPLGTVTQKYETQGGMSVKDEWLDEWKLMYETTWKATASCHFCLSSCVTHNSNFMYLIVLIDNTFSLREEGIKKECHWTLRFPFPGWQVLQCYWCSSGHLF